ncbi:dihydropteroate synthase [Aquihabitans sp. McL0605]|uniref:dihydropteroate synthase n=1 Tax=Aquihabitans sp. McL0605 TaxID=3415671 RepID=UPI003CE8B33B
MTAPDFRPTLRLADRTLDLHRPALMGVVNANPDSFSDPGHRPLEAIVDQVRAMVDEGATVIDVGGQSGITNVPEVDPSEEIDRVAPVVEAIVAELPHVVISVDTYKPAVARAVLEAGAHIVNDVSGLRAPELAPLVAEFDAALVIMHTAAPPKTRLQESGLYDDIVDEVGAFLAAKVAEATAAGVHPEAIVTDPGPDFTKTPAQTVEVLRHLPALNPQALPMLLAISRKDFIGALTHTRPKERMAGTLAAVAAVGSGTGVILRVHDVGEVRRFLTVLDALRSDDPVDPDLRLVDELRWAAGRPDGTKAV